MGLFKRLIVQLTKKLKIYRDRWEEYRATRFERRLVRLIADSITDEGSDCDVIGFRPTHIGDIRGVRGYQREDFPGVVLEKGSIDVDGRQVIYASKVKRRKGVIDRYEIRSNQLCQKELERLHKEQANSGQPISAGYRNIGAVAIPEVTKPRKNRSRLKTGPRAKNRKRNARAN